MAALLLLVGALSANNIRIEWTGTVLNGTDVSNTFGLGVNGNNLTGESFTVEFIVDPTRGYIQSSPNFYAATGGTDVGGGGVLEPGSFRKLDDQRPVIQFPEQHFWRLHTGCDAEPERNLYTCRSPANQCDR